MKQALKNLSTFALALALLAPVSLLAQKEEKEKEVKEKKDVEQIIITRKGEKDEKMVIEINGDKVIVNGKEIKDNEGDVTVNRMKLKELSAFNRFPRTSIYNDANGMSFFNEQSNRAMLGVVTEKSDEGLEIQDVTKESAAEKAGLKKGDIITKIDEKKVGSPDELSEAIKNHKPGDKVAISYLRDKKEQKATAELTKWKGLTTWNMVPDHNFKMDMGDLNFDNVMPKIQTMPRTPGVQGWNWVGSGPKLGLSIQDTDDGKGVKVIEVDEESNAAKAGIKEDDVITEVNGKSVNGADEMAKVIRENKDKVSVMIKLQRSGKTQNVEVKMPRRIKTVDL
jgi:serine protease Do